MANWINWLVGKGENGIIKQVADGVDRFVHTGEEKAQEQANQEEQVTRRWEADAQAPITRLTRPFLVLFTTFCVFIFGALDSSLEGFTISDSYLQMYKEVWIVMVLAYFGGRSYEKTKSK